MSMRPEERRLVRALNRRLRYGSFLGSVARLPWRSAGAYLVNTPVLTIRHQVDLRPHHRVLDLGCGRGDVAAVLAARACLDQPPVCVDLSNELLRLGSHEMGARRPVAMACAAATRLPFADQSFHLVIAAHLFKHLEDETLFRVLLEVLRVLKPGGILLGWEFAPTSSRRLNRLHRRVLSPGRDVVRLRGFGALAPYALYAGFRYADRLELKLPFLFPPIPRVVVMFQKARDTQAQPPQDAWPAFKGAHRESL